MSGTSMGADCCGDRYESNTTVQCNCGCGLFYCSSCYATHCTQLVKTQPKGLNALRDEALRIATEHGFTDATVGEDLMLMVTELAEAMEDHRAGRKPNELGYWVTWLTLNGGECAEFMTAEGLYDLRASNARNINAKPCGIPSELADVFIRGLHFAGKHKIDIEKAVAEKMAYNASRPFKHGGKAL